MEKSNLSFYEKEAARLQSKVEGLFLNVDEFRLQSSAKSSTGFIEKVCDNVCVSICEEDLLYVDEDWLSNVNCWLLDKDCVGEPNPGSISSSLEAGENDSASVNVSDLIRSLRESNIRQLLPISTKTFARPKKGRSSLSNLVSVSPPVESGSPKLRRRLTTTIDPSPALIPHLEKLSLTNNRPLSNCEDLHWEDGEDVGTKGEAPAEGVETTPRRPAVPASLLQRLQELKETNGVRSSFPLGPRPSPTVPSSIVPSLRPLNPMSVSQLMREIPDLENDEPESYLSLGDTSLLSLGEPHLGHLSRFLEGMGQDRRITFGGVELPTGPPHVGNKINKTFVMVDQLVEVSELNSTYTKDDEDSNLSTGAVFNVEIGDENRNTDATKMVHLLKSYSSKLFDQTFPKSDKNEENIARQAEAILDGTFNKKLGVELKMFDAVGNGILNGANDHFDKDAKVAPQKFSPEIEQNTGANGTYLQHEHMSAFTRTEELTRTEHGSSVIRTEQRAYQQAETGSALVKQTQSREDISDPQPFQYSTATYSRPSARFSPARSALPMRRGSASHRLSSEDLARSPARSDGTVTPVDLRPAHGTYTRNSPVERCGSEDEQMSTTSDHSLRSQDSFEDIPDRCRTTQLGKIKVSTPRLPVGPGGHEEWHMSPISRHQGSLSPASSNERLGAVRVIHKGLHGPVPLKPALIRPTDNFKRPAVKKTEAHETQISGRVPVRPGAIKAAPVSGVPKSAGRALPTRIPAGRFSSIPRPPSSRLGTTNTISNKSNS